MAMAACLALSTAASAQAPYYSYIYGIWGYSVPSTAAYLPETVLNGRDLGCGPMESPRDMCLAPSGELYVLDSGKKRVLVLDGELALARIITDFRAADGSRLDLVDPRGIYVDAAGGIYLADRGAQLVHLMDSRGRVRRSLGKPVSDLVPANQEYYPEKVLVDSTGVVYVLSFGFYQGALCYAQDGRFLGFFGANKVTITGKLLSDRFWRLFLTKEQKSKMARYVPAQYVNFAIDSDDFVYTVSDFGDDSQDGQVKKLNPLSNNILFYNRKPDLQYFGDWESYYNSGTSRLEKSSFVDLDVDSEGFISVLDKERGRVFMYDQDSNLLAIFGGPGDQAGCFRSPSAIVAAGERVLVLDEEKDSLTVFRPTRFGNLVRRATALYRQGDYQAALEPWNEVIKLCANYDLAYRGRGKALRQLGRYREAMRDFKLARYQRFYSEAFKDYRNQVLRENFGLFAGAVLLAAGVPLFLGRWRRRRLALAGAAEERARRLKDRSPAAYPLHLLFHPFTGWDDLKFEGKGSLMAANLIMLGSVLAGAARYLLTGFIFNGAKLDEFNILITIANTAGFYFLWTLANWGICTLVEGKGSFKEIWIYSCYAQLVHVVMAIPMIILSRVLVREEGVFLTILDYLIRGWGVLQLVCAMKAVHQFSLKGTLLSMGLTVLGILLIVAVFLLLYTLIAQFAAFGVTVYREILLRT